MSLIRILPSLLVTLAALLAVPVAALVRGAEGGLRPVIVVVSPFDDAAGIIADAGGRPLLPVAGFASGYSSDANFIDRLHNLGALAVFDAARFGRLCAAEAASATP